MIFLQLLWHIEKKKMSDSITKHLIQVKFDQQLDDFEIFFIKYYKNGDTKYSNNIFELILQIEPSLLVLNEDFKSLGTYCEVQDFFNYLVTEGQTTPVSQTSYVAKKIPKRIRYDE